MLTKLIYYICSSKNYLTLFYIIVKLKEMDFLGGIIMNKPYYKSSDSLVDAVKVVNEAGEFLADSKKIEISGDVKEIVAGLVGASAGVGTGVIIVTSAAAAGTAGAAAITSGLATAGSIVGGGMLAGIFVVAAPVAILAGGGIFIASRVNKSKLRKKKEMLLQEAVRKQNKIIKKLQNEVDASGQRMESLTHLNIALRQIIERLESDLKNREKVA